jgi:opacity protein-like surface antigen
MLALLLTTGLAAAQAAAQDAIAERKPLSIEAGIQCNVLLDRLLGSTNASNSNPYLILGKVACGNTAFRLGIGGNRSKDKKQQEGFADSQTTLNQGIQLRLGAERRYELGKRWFGSFGFDAVADRTENKTINDSGFDVETKSTVNRSIGGGLVAGLQFHITEKLSLYTEGFLYYTFGETRSGRFFKNFPEFNDDVNTTDTQDLIVGLPSVLYVVVKF